MRWSAVNQVIRLTASAAILRRPIVEATRVADVAVVSLHSVVVRSRPRPALRQWILQISIIGKGRVARRYSTCSGSVN